MDYILSDIRILDFGRFIACIMNSIWQRLADVVGHVELLGEVSLKDDYARWEERHRLDQLVADWVKIRNVAEVIEAMDKAHIPCAPYLDLYSVPDDPNIMETSMLPSVDFGISALENVPVSGFPLNLPEFGEKTYHAPPRTGENNRQVYTELLGYSIEYLEQLEREGII